MRTPHLTYSGTSKKHKRIAAAARSLKNLQDHLYAKSLSRHGEHVGTAGEHSRILKLHVFLSQVLQLASHQLPHAAKHLLLPDVALVTLFHLRTGINLIHPYPKPLTPIINSKSSPRVASLEESCSSSPVPASGAGKAACSS